MDHKKLLEIRKMLQSSDAPVDRVFDVESLTRVDKKTNTQVSISENVNSKFSAERRLFDEAALLRDMTSVKVLIRDFEKTEGRLKFEISSLKTALEEKNEELKRLKIHLAHLEGAKSLSRKGTLKSDEILNSDLYQKVLKESESSKKKIRLLEEKVKSLQYYEENRELYEAERRELSLLRHAVRDVIDSSALTAARREFYARSSCADVIYSMKLKDDKD